MSQSVSFDGARISFGIKFEESELEMCELDFKPLLTSFRGCLNIKLKFFIRGKIMLNAPHKN